jgi:dephospho-CoA kinase
VDRRTLGHLVFGDESKRRQLEELIHPPVVEDFILKAKRLRDSGEAGCKCLIADIPLLFEVGAEKHCDLVVVVACTRSTQKRRLVSNRNVSSGVAEQMTLSQLPIEEKILRADGVVWSECSMAVLLEQLAFVTSRLETR